MAESSSHKKGKGNAARKEVPFPGGRRLDAIRGSAAVEVERGGTPKKIDQALSRLRTQRSKSKILRVPQRDMGLAVDRARRRGMSVTVTNLSKTRRRKS